MNMDPLRVRVRFLEVLPPEDRLALVQEARDKLGGYLEVIGAAAREDKRRGDTFRYLADRSAILSVRAQVAWLDEVEATLGRTVGAA